MENMINLLIDKRPVSVPKGTTVLDAAASIGINIPALCHMDLKGTCVKSSPAACRICVVEIEGRRNLAPSCATMVTEGMVVSTNSARVRPQDRGRTHPLRPSKRLSHLPQVQSLRTSAAGYTLQHQGNALQGRTVRAQKGSYRRHYPQHGQVHPLPPLREHVQQCPDGLSAGGR